MPGQRQANGRAKGQGIRPQRNGLIAAYLLVFAIIAGSAALVLGDIAVAPPQVVEQAAAATPTPASTTVQSLPLPLRPPPSGFRSFSPTELAAMTETTSDGFRLPRIAPDGWMPWIANARRFDPAAPPARIGLLMINLGASEAAMKRAIEELPAEVSLAFLPGTPDLPRWLAQARTFGHESYLMLPIEDLGTAERGIRPIDSSADAAENLRRLRLAMARGSGYVGVVVSSPNPVSQSETILRPLVKEIADRGLALVEINPTRETTQRLTSELGAGYARSADVLDYKLAGESVLGNLDRLAAWVADATPGRPPRHAFGVMQPDDEAIDAIVTWSKGLRERSTISFVPLIGHFECRDACMKRLQVQPAQLRP